MAHDHTHGHSHTHEQDSTRNMKIAFVLNLSFAIVEVIGGLLTNSIAILSDAVHDLGDAFSIGVSYFLEKFSRKKRSRTFSYGYKRFSVLGALINSVVLLVGSIYILIEVFPRLMHPEPVHHTGMMWMAIAGIVFNGFPILRLRNSKSVSQRAVMLHLMEDLLGWIAVLAGSILIKITGWMFIDPLLSLGICVFILYNVFRNFKAIFRILLQSVPDEATEENLKNKLTTISGVESVHDIHTWTLDGIQHIASVHLVVPDATTRSDMIRIKREAFENLRTLGVDHLTVEIEFPEENCCCDDYL